MLSRCKEIEKAPDGHLDLWAREHFKSSIITVGLSIQDILKDPDITIGIFSHTRPIAKKFLRQIKWQFESNDLLKDLFPDILYRHPAKESPKWSEDEGIIVKRKHISGEATVEAWGLVDGQPTSKHFRRLVYDDVVTDKSVTTPEIIQKTTDAMALSFNLGEQGGTKRFIGTRYHFNDTYRDVIDRQIAIPRIYPATEDGTPTGEPVFMSAELLAQKRREQGPYIYACQMLQNPVADETQGFKNEWLRYADVDGDGLNKYIIVDPASKKKKTNDYTAIWVVGLGTDSNYYCIEIIRDRLSLTQRADTIFNLHRKYRPNGVGYEEYGLQADIEHIKDRQKRETYHFDITPLGGKLQKEDRIKTLIPLFEQNRIYLPTTCYKANYEGKVEDLVNVFINQEYLSFPVSIHDDMLDSLARINDPNLNLIWPMPEVKADRYRKKHSSSSNWAN